MCKIFVFKEPLVTSLCSYLNAFKKMLIRQFGIFISVTSAIFRGAFVKFDYTSNLTKVFKSLSEKYFKMRSTHSLLRKCSMVEDEVNLSILRDYFGTLSHHYHNIPQVHDQRKRYLCNQSENILFSLTVQFS